MSCLSPPGQGCLKLEANRAEEVEATHHQHYLQALGVIQSTMHLHSEA